MPYPSLRYVRDNSPSLPIVLATLVGILSLVLAVEMGWLFRKKLDVKGKHCYITGGSQGLGRALALELVKRGAHVTVVARGKGKLEETVTELKAIAQPDQIIQYVSADLTSPESSSTALEEASRAHGGKVPEHIYMCAGSSRPQFFIDASSQTLKDSLDGTYWVQAWTAHAASKLMIAQRIKGKLIFVSSFIGYTSFAGYSTYAPGKYALRGLADSLRSEMLLHDIAVHIFMPAGIDSPGYVEEQRSKPRITRKIEEDDVVLSPENVAGSLISGLERNHYQITNLLITDLIRVTAQGAVPGNNRLLDAVYTIISLIGVPIWRMMTDATVRKDGKVVRKELKERGYYTASH